MPSQSSAGAVSAERAGLDGGEAAATVRMRRPGVVVLSASYDPGWTATVNGRRWPAWMVAPALVAVDVLEGTDHVVFRFHGYGGYPALLALSGLILAIAAAAPVCARRAGGTATLKQRRMPLKPAGSLPEIQAVPKALLHDHLDWGDGGLLRSWGARLGTAGSAVTDAPSGVPRKGHR